jgi:hypothetical protein
MATPAARLAAVRGSDLMRRRFTPGGRALSRKRNDLKAGRGAEVPRKIALFASGKIAQFITFPGFPKRIPS